MPGFKNSKAAQNDILINALNEALGDSTLSGITRFLEIDSRDDIIAHWAKCNATDDAASATLIIKSLSALLIKIDGEREWTTAGTSLVRRIIAEHQKSFFRNISSARPMYVNPTLRLLISMAQYDAGNLASEVYNFLEFPTFTALLKLLVKGPSKVTASEGKVVLGKRKRQELEAGGSTRTLMIALIFTLLKNAQQSCRAELLSHQQISRDLFRYLPNDDASAIVKTLHRLTRIIEDRDIPRPAKVRFFNERTLSYMTSLYSKDTATSDGGEEVDIRTALQAFFLRATTIPDNGLCFETTGLQPPPNFPKVKLFNPILGNFITCLRPIDDDLQLELLLAILKTTPELIYYYVTNTHFDLTPKLDIKWIKSMTIFDNIISIPFPEGHPVNAELPQWIVVENCLPSALSRILLKGFQDESNLVKLMTCKTLLSALEKLSGLLNKVDCDYYDELVETVQEKCPDIQILLPLTTTAEISEVEEVALLREASIGVLSLYVRMFMDLPSFDFVTLFHTILGSQSIVTATTSEKLNVLQMIENIQGVQWLTKKRTSDSVFMTIMQFITRDASNEAGMRDVALKALNKLTSIDTFMFVYSPIPRIEALTRSLKLDKKQLEHVLRFVEECMIRFQTSPYKYYDQTMTVSGHHNLSLNSSAIMPASPILAVFEEQKAFLPSESLPVVELWLRGLNFALHDLGEELLYYPDVDPNVMSSPRCREDEITLYHGLVMTVQIMRDLENQKTSDKAKILSDILRGLAVADRAVLKQEIITILKRTSCKSLLPVAVVQVIVDHFDAGDLHSPGFLNIIRRLCEDLTASDQLSDIAKLVPEDIARSWIRERMGPDLEVKAVAGLLSCFSDVRQLSIAALLPAAATQVQQFFDSRVLAIYTNAADHGVFNDLQQLTVPQDLVNFAKSADQGTQASFVAFMEAILRQAHHPAIDPLSLELCRSSPFDMCAPLLSILSTSSEQETAESALRLIEGYSEHILNSDLQTLSPAIVCCTQKLVQAYPNFAQTLLLKLLRLNTTLSNDEESLILACLAQGSLEEDEEYREPLKIRNRAIADLLTRRFAEDRAQEGKFLATEVLRFVETLTMRVRSQYQFAEDCTRVLLEPLSEAAIENQTHHPEVVTLLTTIVSTSDNEAFNYRRIVQDLINKKELLLSSPSGLELAQLLLKTISVAAHTIDINVLDTLIKLHDGTCAPFDMVLFECISAMETVLALSMGSRFGSWRFLETMKEITDLRTDSKAAQLEATICSELAVNTIDNFSTICKSQGLLPLYDIRYIVPLISAYMFSDSSVDCLRQLISHNGLGLVMVTLSHDDPELRVSASRVLSQIFSVLNESSVREKQQLSTLLLLLQNSLTLSSLKQEPVPLIQTTFLAKAIPILLQPSHFLFEPISKYFLARPVLDFTDSPMFLTLFCAHENYLKSIRFLLDLLEAGVPISALPDQDLETVSYLPLHLGPYRRRHVLEMLMGLYDSSSTPPTIQSHIVRIFIRFARARTGAKQWCQKSGMHVWADCLAQQMFKSSIKGSDYKLRAAAKEQETTKIEPSETTVPDEIRTLQSLLGRSLLL